MSLMTKELEAEDPGWLILAPRPETCGFVHSALVGFDTYPILG